MCCPLYFNSWHISRIQSFFSTKLFVFSIRVLLHWGSTGGAGQPFNGSPCKPWPGGIKEEEAVSLLSESLGSTQLLADGCLAEYNGCLSWVLDCCTRLPPSTVSRLLACFDLGGFSAAILHRGTPDAEHNAVRHSASFCIRCCA